MTTALAAVALTGAQGCSLVSLDGLSGDGGGAAVAGPSTSSGGQGGGPAGIGGGGGGLPAGTAGSAGGGGGGDGGSGGAPPAIPCGGPGALGADFDDASAGLALWVIEGDGDVRIETGAAVLRPPEDGSEGNVVLRSAASYDLRGDALAARFLEVLDPGVTDASSSMSLVTPSGDYVALRLLDGELSLVTWIDDAYVTHALADHVAGMEHWRLRHAPPDLVAETSLDGDAWTELGSIPLDDLFDLALVRPWFDARVPEGAGDAGAVRIEAVEGLFPGAAHCPASSLVDAFDDGQRSSEWGAGSDPRCGPDEAMGELRFPFQPDSSWYCNYGSRRRFDLRGDGVVIRMTSQSSAVTAEGYLHVEDTRSEGAIITATGETIAAMQRVPERAILRSEPYVAADEPWWRLRDDGGIVRYELSADGQTWRELGAAPAWFDTSAVQIVVAGGTWDMPADPGLVAFDDLNLPPP